MPDVTVLGDFMHMPGRRQKQEAGAEEKQKTTTVDASDGQYGRFGGSPVPIHALARPRCQQNDEGYWIMMPDVCLSC
jgi:hypothetical protein